MFIRCFLVSGEIQDQRDVLGLSSVYLYFLIIVKLRSIRFTTLKIA